MRNFIQKNRFGFKIQIQTKLLGGQTQIIKRKNRKKYRVYHQVIAFILFLFQGNMLYTKDDRTLATMKAPHLSTETTHLRGYNQESIPTEVLLIN